MFWPFKRKIKPAVKPTKPTHPGIGGRYYLDTRNPFERVEAIVLDTKEGWVKYQFTYNGYTGSTWHSIEISTFNKIYKPCN